MKVEVLGGEGEWTYRLTYILNVRYLLDCLASRMVEDGFRDFVFPRGIHINVAIPCSLNESFDPRHVIAEMVRDLH
jgi:hypothetical protein